MPTIGETVNTLTARFAEAGMDTPRLDARILVAHVLETEPTKLFVNSTDPFPDDKTTALKAVTARRIAHEPVSRILVHREFWGLTFEISPATLDPRPDTETLVEAALRLRQPGKPARLLDMGTGSGCILLSILSSWPEAQGIGVDLSDDALVVASRNAAHLGLADRATFQRGSWCEGLAAPFDVIVSNPPYITDAEMTELAPDVAEYDPALALRGGADGLDAYRAIIPGAQRLLSPGGTLLFEVGHTQADSVAGLLAANHFEPAVIHRDFGGVARVVEAKLPARERGL